MLSKRIFLDFETRCDLDISEVGTYKYVHHESFEVVLIGFKFGDGPTYVYERIEELVDEDFTIDGHQLAHYIYAHAAYFDWMVYCKVYKQYNWPEEFTNLNMWIDSQGLAARYTLPLKLAEAGKALALPVQKQTGGLALIKKICCPPFKYTTEDMNKFMSYCNDDVESMYELVKALPHSELSEQEQKLWVLTQKMNMRGFPVDLETTDAVVRTVEMFLESQQENLPDLTNGKITKITQYQRMKKFAHDHGVMIPNTQHAVLGEWIQKDMPQEVKDVLTLRYEFGSSALNKFKTIRNYHIEGRVHDSYCYYGAQKTGRWAGRGLQPTNLPRASVDNPEDFIEKFRNYIPLDNPIQIAKALVRPMICAPKGYQLIVSDFKSVEYRDIVWVSQDEKILTLIRKGLDPYIDMAAFLFNVAYDEVTPEQRFMGKIIILGCTYGMGAGVFQKTAATYGVIATLAEAKYAVDAFRLKYRLTKSLWYGLFKKALLAVKHPGVKFEYKGLKLKGVKDRTGRPWLAMFLHSGRPLMYMQPKIQEGKYGEEITHMGVNPYSKKWTRLSITPGRLTENVGQGECRDIMGNGLLNLENDMPEVDVLGTVHDEAISLIKEADITDKTMEIYNAHLCRASKWAEGLPLEAEGYIAKRYKKG